MNKVTLTVENIDLLLKHFIKEHSCTSCDDYRIFNDGFVIDETELQGVVVKRTMTRGPRCSRCFLWAAREDLKCGLELPKGLHVSVDIDVGVEQPNIEIKQL